MTYHLRSGLLKLAPLRTIPNMYFAWIASVTFLCPESRNTIQLPPVHIQTIEMVGGGTFGQHSLGLVCACAVCGEGVASQSSGIVACPPESGGGIAHVKTVICESCISAHTLPSVLVEEVVGEQSAPRSLRLRHCIQIAVLDVRVVNGEAQLVCIGNYTLLGVELHHPHPNRHVGKLTVDIDMADGFVIHGFGQIESGHVGYVARCRHKVDVAVAVCHHKTLCLLRPCYMAYVNSGKSGGLVEYGSLGSCVVVCEQTARSECEAHVAGGRNLSQVGVAGIHLPCANSQAEGIKHGRYIYK